MKKYLFEIIAIPTVIAFMLGVIWAAHRVNASNSAIRYTVQAPDARWEGATNVVRRPQSVSFTHDGARITVVGNCVVTEGK